MQGQHFFLFLSFFFSSNSIFFTPSCIHTTYPCLIYGSFSCVFILLRRKEPLCILGIPLPSARVQGCLCFSCSRRPFATCWESVHVQVRCFPACSLAFGRRGESENFTNTSRASYFPPPPELLKYWMRLQRKFKYKAYVCLGIGGGARGEKLLDSSHRLHTLISAFIASITKQTLLKRKIQNTN